MSEPDAVLVLFGATGDLAKRLIVPALYRLRRGGRLAGRFVLLGVGRQGLDDVALAAHYRAALHEFSGGSEPDAAVWEPLAGAIRYHQADIADPGAFGGLRAFLDGIDQQWGTRPQRVFYLATPPSLFGSIAASLGEAGLADERERARIVVEKPLGHDLASSLVINATLRRYFKERQIFRIDHFLGKETVQNILALRFANPIFEPVWNRRYVDHVAITVAETLGVEQRGDYYDRAGAMCDMVQNHLFQLLCLVAMEPPVAYDAEDIRGKKLDVLRSVRPIARHEVVSHAARGQYAAGWVGGRPVCAYREESAVAPDSGTETYAALKLYVDNWRWQGVPFYLRTGKRLAADVSEISIRFSDVPHRAFPVLVGMNTQPVRLVIQIQPSPGIVLKFNVKEPGFELRLRPVDMRFCYRDTFDRPAPEAYETLLRDAMRGDATLFMRADHVEAAWSLLEPVLSVWREVPPVDFPNYAAGTWGPEAAQVLVATDGRSWLVPTLSGRTVC